MGAVGVGHAVDAVDLIGTGQAGTALDRNAPHRGLSRPQRSNRRLRTYYANREGLKLYILRVRWASYKQEGRKRYDEKF